jgi:hypothetical protein
MSVTISKESNNCIVVTITGVFTYQDLTAVQNAAKELLNTGAKVNCLILAAQFGGWGKEGNWGDLTFMYENDTLMGKIAVVAYLQHKDGVMMFLGADRRQAAVKFFLQDEEDQARRWLSEPVR